MSTFNHLLMIILSNIYLLPVQVKSSSGSDSKQMQTPPSGCFCVDANCNFLDCSQNESSSLSSTYTYTSYQCDRSYRDGHRKFPMHLDDVLQNSLDSMLCLQKSNSPVTEGYFSPSSNEDVDRDETFWTKDYSFNFPPPSKEDYYSDLNDEQLNSYSLDDYIPLVNKEGYHVDGGSLKLPVPNDSGFCQDLNEVLFGRNIDHNLTCIRNLPMKWDSSYCEESVLSLLAGEYGLFVGKQRDALNYANSNMESNEKFVPITVDTIILNNGTAIRGQELTPTIQTKWENETSICRNIKQDVRYVVEYIEDNSINKISCNLTLIDIDLDPITNSSTASIEQHFSITFKPSFFVDDTIKTSPGYLFGSAIKTNNTGATVDNLQVLNSPTCNSMVEKENVGFGIDLNVGCSIGLKVDDLKELCTATTSPFITLHNFNDRPSYVPSWFTSVDRLKIGKYANSNLSDPENWLGISIEDFAYSRQWIESKRLCSGIPTSLHIKFLWSHIGHVSSPQQIIRGVSASFQSSHLRHTSKYHNESKDFIFTTIVSWVLEDNYEKKKYIPPHDPFLFTLPADSFYPFESTTSATYIKSFRSRFFSFSFLLTNILVLISQ